MMCPFSKVRPILTISFSLILPPSLVFHFLSTGFSIIYALGLCGVDKTFRQLEIDPSDLSLHQSCLAPINACSLVHQTFSHSLSQMKGNPCTQSASDLHLHEMGCGVRDDLICCFDGSQLAQGR